MAPFKYRIAITPGEPAGIGVDICVQLAQQTFLNEIQAEIVVIADPRLLEERARILGLPLSLESYNSEKETTAQTSKLTILSVPCPNPVICGKIDKENVDYILGSLKLAVQSCLSSGFDALVTGPVHKGIINDAGIPFTGHTEYLAKLTNTPQVVMMLATEGLRVALVTTHLPLNKVSDAITPEQLETVLRITHENLQSSFAIENPRMLICGLNPHAGEDGHLGTEERDIMIPVITKLQQEGMQLQGPLSADTLFIPKYLDNTDVVIAMYHDQGLPVLKHMGFGRAINITLGLPFVRTSVDHGTALELAGSGTADLTSMKAAIKTASNMLHNRTRETHKQTNDIAC